MGEGLNLCTQVIEMFLSACTEIAPKSHHQITKHNARRQHTYGILFMYICIHKFLCYELIFCGLPIRQGCIKYISPIVTHQIQNLFWSDFFFLCHSDFPYDNLLIFKFLAVFHG